MWIVRREKASAIHTKEAISKFKAENTQKSKSGGQSKRYREV